MFIFFFVWFVPGGWTLSAHLKKEKKAPGEKLPALTPVPDGVEFGQSHEPVNTIPHKTIRRFQFHECRQLFIRTHNERLRVVAMCVCYPDQDRDKPRTGSAASRLAVTISGAGLID